MAIYGIGAYVNSEDVCVKFIKRKIVGVGWDYESAPDLHEFLKSMKVGDIIYIKSAPPGGDVTVKAIGIIIDNELVNDDIVRIGRHVNWVNKQGFVFKPSEIEGKNNVRSNTIYEEFSPNAQKRILKEFKFI